jgi:hypothetical protein
MLRSRTMRQSLTPGFSCVFGYCSERASPKDCVLLSEGEAPRETPQRFHQSSLLLRHLLRISRRQRDPIRQLSVEADLESILARLGQWNVENQHRAGFDVDHAGRRLPELDRALTTQQLASALVHKPDSDGMNSDFGPPAADPEHQMRAGVHGGKVGKPDMLEHAEHAELALLIDQGIVGYDRKVEMQIS